MSRKTDQGEEPFLKRWSRLSRLPEDEVSPDLCDDGDAVREPVSPADGVPESRTEAQILAELDLPDPDDLEKGSDFSAFMRDGVPAAIRRRALRKLWTTDPVLANLDELLDYGGDFTDAGLGAGVVETAYKVGRGFVKDIVEGDESAENEAPPEVVADSDETDDGDMPAGPDPRSVQADDPPAPIAKERPPAVASRKRMAFTAAPKPDLPS